MTSSELIEMPNIVLAGVFLKKTPAQSTYAGKKLVDIFSYQDKDIGFLPKLIVAVGGFHPPSQ